MKREGLFDSDIGFENPNSTLKKLLNEIGDNPRFTRSKNRRNDTLLSFSNGNVFRISRVKNQCDKHMSAAMNFLDKEFPGEDLDSAAIMRESISNKNSIILKAVGNEGALAGLLITDYLELSSDQAVAFVDGNLEFSSPMKAIVFDDYIIVDEPYRHLRLATELHRASYEYVYAMARRKKQTIVAMVCESRNGFEGFFNNLGRKRIYFDIGFNDYCEVPYIQPSMVFDKDTGEPEGKKMAHNLMLRLPLILYDISLLNIQELMAIVEVIYQKEYLPPRSYFNSDAAYNVCRSVIQAELDTLENKLSMSARSFSQRCDDARLVLLSRAAREGLTARAKKENINITFVEHNLA